jgi:hypothetical protein
MKEHLSWNWEMFRVVLFLFLAPLFGGIFKDLSNGFEEGMKLGKKRKIWIIMMTYMVQLALLIGWLVPFSWRSLIILVLAAPLFGYLAMVGAMNVEKLRGRLFGGRFGKH